MKATIDKPTAAEASDAASQAAAAVAVFEDTARTLDRLWEGRVYPTGPREAVRAEYLARCDEAQECLHRALQAAGICPVSEWLESVLRRLTSLVVPLSPADEADPDQVPGPTAAVSARSLRTLLELQVPGMPEPTISPTGAGGLEFDWSSDDFKLMVGFEVDPEKESVYAWGRSEEKSDSWSGTVADSREKIRHVLGALVSA